MKASFAVVAAAIALLASGAVANSGGANLRDPDAPVTNRVDVLHVDVNASPGGDGTGQAPFNNLAEAVEHGRTSVHRVKILVAPGVYELSSPLVIDYPLELSGSNEMAYEPGSGEGSGWPTGAVTPGSETILRPAEGFSWPNSLIGALVQVGDDDALVLMGDVTIRNLTFDAGPAGPGTDLSWHNDLSIHRTQGYDVRSNVILGAFNSGILSLWSSGRIVGNYIEGVGCATCIGGGDDASPAHVEYLGNRAVNNDAGLFLVGTILTPGAKRLEAEVVGNDLSHNTKTRRSTSGVRIAVSAPQIPGSDAVDGSVTAHLRDNRIVGNEIGLIIDAGFPNRDTQCASRLYTGSIDVTLGGNLLADSRLTDAIISFRRFSASLDEPCGQAQWQYLRNATYTIDDPDGSIGGYWIDHVENNPFFSSSPPCSPEDGEPLGNRLFYNGAEQPFGFNVPSPPAPDTCGEAITCASCCQLGDSTCFNNCARGVCDAQVQGPNISTYFQVLSCTGGAVGDPNRCGTICATDPANCLACIIGECAEPISTCNALTCP